MIFKCCLILQFYGGFTVEFILAKFNFTVRVVPGITAITINPIFAIDFSVVSPTKVHLVTIVAFLIVFETIVAPLTELYFLA